MRARATLSCTALCLKSRRPVKRLTPLPIGQALVSPSRRDWLGPGERCWITSRWGWFGLGFFRKGMLTTGPVSRCGSSGTHTHTRSRDSLSRIPRTAPETRGLPALSLLKQCLKWGLWMLMQLHARARSSGLLQAWVHNSQPQPLHVCLNWSHVCFLRPGDEKTSQKSTNGILVIYKGCSQTFTVIFLSKLLALKKMFHLRRSN